MAAGRRGSRFHPYRALGALGVELAVAALDDDVMGDYDHEQRVVRLDRGLRQAERRCTAAHEYVHAVRGDLPSCTDWHERKQERVVERVAARLLIPLEDLARASLWSDDVTELADDLWVDVDTLRQRLRDLRPDERDFVVSYRAERSADRAADPVADRAADPVADRGSDSESARRRPWLPSRSASAG
ncbi:MAG: ImmA/IrrE family metallo-endopeptidase [Frankiaceae bacterium]